MFTHGVFTVNTFDCKACMAIVSPQALFCTPLPYLANFNCFLISGSSTKAVSRSSSLGASVSALYQLSDVTSTTKSIIIVISIAYHVIRNHFSQVTYTDITKTH